MQIDGTKFYTMGFRNVSERGFEMFSSHPFKSNVSIARTNVETSARTWTSTGTGVVQCTEDFANFLWSRKNIATKF